MQNVKVKSHIKKSIQGIYNYYSKIDVSDMSNKVIGQLKDDLRSFDKNDLKTIEEHKMFLELLSKFRNALREIQQYNGANFLKTMQSLLSVGEDGVYSNRMRFLYELIQNVDDCEYESISDAKLDIKFEWNNNPGRVILTYNETGFTPDNVFAITGIAEASKNISSSKTEIGEKGIGFKSVFGIADKVIIQSGMFSFSLYKENFTVPVLEYNNFSGISGTKLILEMNKCNEVEGLFRNLADRYKSNDAALNQNMILFLNKLTHLKMYYDGFRFIEFNVDRKDPIKYGEVYCENNIHVSVKVCNTFNGKEFENDIECTRYTMPIRYDREKCISRYSSSTNFEYRNHNIIAVFPKNPDELRLNEGRMYSFLPTQIKIQAPVILHVPFKLDGSREFVDPQGENAWFLYTVEKLSIFLKSIYTQYAHEVKEDIVNYLPVQSKMLFKKDNQKITCLNKDCLKASVIYSEKIFYTVDGEFESLANIASFTPTDVFDDYQSVYRMLGLSKKLFIPSKKTLNMKLFGCEIIDNVKSRLFVSFLKNPSYSSDIASALRTEKADLFYFELKKYVEDNVVRLSSAQLSCIAKYDNLKAGFHKYIYERINAYKEISIFFEDKRNKLTNKDAETINLNISTLTSLNSKIVSFYNKRKDNLLVFDNVDENFFMAFDNVIVLSKKDPLAAFANFILPFDKQKTFYASLMFKRATDKLNSAPESMSNKEYLGLLKDVRSFLVNAFGERTYQIFVKLINESGKDGYRFLNELLQNADDCDYAPNVIPSFSLDIDNNLIKTCCNELGFTKNNVRAITSIGESTKKALLSNEKIGEKGVGFKSVFGVAQKVEIHSKDFHFLLTAEKPTVPVLLDDSEYTKGTSMKFIMKTRLNSIFTEKYILPLCLCLRKLRNIRIYNINIRIEDTDNSRFITVNGVTYTFEKINHAFSVTEDLIKERFGECKSGKSKQKITCYISDNNEIRRFVYSGLPTTLEAEIPIIIDAPFDLTTSRDYIINSSWNNCVKDNIFEAIKKVSFIHRKEDNLDCLKYLGFKSINQSQYEFRLFNDSMLNKLTWLDSIRRLEILPLLYSNRYAAAANEHIVYVPNVIYKISELIDLRKYFGNNIVKYELPSKYSSKPNYSLFIETLGVAKSKLKDNINCIADNIKIFLQDKDLRKELYDYLGSSQNEIQKLNMDGIIRNLPIFPVRMGNGYMFIPYKENIYTHPNMSSGNGIYILATDIMDFDTSHKLLGANYRIDKWSVDVGDSLALKRFQDMLISNKDNEVTAEAILAEFNNNNELFLRCRSNFAYLKDSIPMLMADGNYKSGIKFRNASREDIKGELLEAIIVDEKYDKFAAFLGCTDILAIHYHDIAMLNLHEISDKDIASILDFFENSDELIRDLLFNNIISDEQIERFELLYYAATEKRDDFEEDFPEAEVKNIDRLINAIRYQAKNNPNHIVEKERIVHEPLNPVDKVQYTTGMYSSTLNSDKCFCQMCQNIVHKEYIERNNVRKKPEYEWAQMYLSLCLKCSKDYVLMRGNRKIWEQFTKAILEAKVSNVGNVEVPIADRKIRFTATHLAEIQEIIRLGK